MKNTILIAEKLNTLLADSYLLMLKTHNFHWNVMGPAFFSLHQLFEQQYQALFAAVDEIAERVRALNENAAGSFAEFSQLATIKEVDSQTPSSEMVANLLHDHETIISNIRGYLTLASEAEDETTLGLLTERLHEHEKTAWMLRSTLA